MKKIIFLSLSALVIFLLQSCGPGTQDFQKSLTNNYNLNKSSSANIIISPKEGYINEEEIIPTKVVGVNVYENYIIAQRLVLENEKLNGNISNNKIAKKNSYDFWIIDSEKKQILKKLSYSQFLIKCDSLKIPRSINLVDIYTY
ncbi:DUF3997 domain-containing protein [Flavobacterium sp. 9AF]|uniref:DUF3997 domain-containing protein n=1 Tax=Flavobacterium sp. 9AF TaxID=2653142 RepID=UPI0013576BC3|nr:DUF3997 domain-containing protein [Flavobacterium sp. 9AF]